MRRGEAVIDGLRPCPDCGATGLIWRELKQVECRHCEGKKYIGPVADAAKRVEVIGEAVLLLGDCLEVLPHLGKVDAVVTDPPYGIAYSPGGGGRAAFGKRGVHKRFTGDDIVIGDKAPFDPAMLLELDAAARILWGGNHYASRLPDSPAWLFWDKHCAESGLSFAEGEFAWTDLPVTAKAFRHLWNGVAKASECGVSRVHPTQKPVALLEWCLRLLSQEISSVVDPFMGSGTTGVACIKTGRKFIGMEIHEPYFDIACARIREAHRQPDMFVAPAPKPVQTSLLDGDAA